MREVCAHILLFDSFVSETICSILRFSTLVGFIRSRSLLLPLPLNISDSVLFSESSVCVSCLF